MKNEKYLLISDVDDTMLGGDGALEQFLSGMDDMPIDLDIAYASGRFYNSIVESVRGTALPRPVAIIGGVGTQIYTFPEGERIGNWEEQMSEHWSAEKVRSTLEGEPGLIPQGAEDQSKFKVSYYLYDATGTRLKELQKKLADNGIRVSCVYSSNRDLDFLPEGVNKGSAAAYLAEQWGFDKDHVFVAGNSANDSALFHHGFSGIIVGNAHDELKALASDPDNYLAENGYAAGVLEGIQQRLLKVS